MRSCEDRMAIESAQRLSFPRLLSGDYTKSPLATDEGLLASASEILHKNWNILVWPSMGHSRRVGLSDQPLVKGLARSSHMGLDHRTSTRQHHSRTGSRRNLPRVSDRVFVQFSA